MKVTKSNGQLQALDIQKIHNHAEFACEGLEGVSQSELETSAHITFYEGMPTKEIQQTLILTAADKIKEHYNWNFVASRLLLMSLFKEVTSGELVYPSLKSYIDKAVALGELAPEMADNGFDFARLDAAIKPERDMKFTYLGLSTLMDRYFRRDSANGNGILELPQHFYMRVAMGLTLYGVEDASETTDRAIEFYDNLSSFDFHNSTPTLFNAGTRTPQLSSCYLLSMGDSLDGIMGTCTEAANYSKLSGGIGVDMSQVRGNGSLIKGTSGRSGGIVPFAKTTESTIAAFNQMGKRKGAGALYLADWHMDIEHFLDLKNETGDPRTRIPDLQTAVWLSDLFLERKEDPEAMFSLFCPNTVPALNETYGEEFRKIYEQAEAEGLYVRQIRALTLWKKIVNSAFDTGSYYHGHKDMINRRSMQKGTGMVRSSNLCCVAADQRVSTDKGLFTVAELFQMQTPVKVPGLTSLNDASVMYLPRPDAPMVKIHTKEGYTHKVTPDHKVWVKEKGWTEAQDLRSGDLLLTQQTPGGFGTWNDPEAAFLMGLIAGDGTYGSTGVCIDLWVGKTDSFQSEVERCAAAVVNASGLTFNSRAYLEPKFAAEGYGKLRLNSAALDQALACKGFRKETKLNIPELVWKGTRDTVAAYLKGLYAADGTVSTSTEVSTMSLSSTQYSLVSDLQILLASLCIKTSINLLRDEGTRLMPDGKGGHKEYDCKPVYRLLCTSIKACKTLETFTSLAALRASCGSDSAKVLLSTLASKEGYAQKLTATFTHLEPMPNEDAYCLTVDSDTHAWVNNGLVTKNTEITLNTVPNEVSAVCNIGSLNLANYTTDEALEKTIRTSVRMLDNVVSIGLVPHVNGRRFQDMERAIGLGIMGEAEYLAKHNIPFDSMEHLVHTATFMKKVSRYTIEASADLAAERGAYPLFEQSEWAKGVLPYDTAPALAKYLIPGFSWDYADDATLRAKTMKGMRNSHTMAIAPTATISNIVGTSSCTELPLELVDVKENLSGTFVDRAPTLKYQTEEQAQTAREVDQWWVLAAAGVRQVYIDQAQSTNLFLPIGLKYADGTQVKGSTISDWYSFAGQVLKTTYYLRNVNSGAKTDADKAADAEATLTQEQIYCSIENPGECESCQ